jgi:hypothetical protein
MDNQRAIIDIKLLYVRFMLSSSFTSQPGHKFVKINIDFFTEQILATVTDA